MTVRVVVLLSGSGTLFASLLDQVQAQAGTDDPLARVTVVAVGADREAPGLELARRAGITTFVHALEKGADRAAWDVELADLVEGHAPDLVVSAGFMKLLGPSFLARFGGRTINTHPALLPSFPGMHGPRDALAHGVKVTGATVFLVDEGVDTGAILAQGAVEVLAEDTVDTLHERIKVVERQLLVDVVREFARTLEETR